MSSRIVPLKIGPVANTLHESQVAEGALYSTLNCSAARGVLEHGPAGGTIYARGSAHAGDLGYGWFYGAWLGTEEILAVVKHNGESVCRLYKVSGDLTTWTAVAHNGSDALPVGDYGFAQFDDWIYAFGPSGTYKRKIGASAGDDQWQVWWPEFVKTASAGDTIDRPPYVAYSFPGSTTVTQARGNSTWGATTVASEIINLQYTGGDEPRALVVVTLPAAEDWSSVDFAVMRFEGPASHTLTHEWPFGMTQPYTMMNRPEWRIGFSNDAAASITEAWALGRAHSSLCEVTTGGSVMECVFDLRSLTAAQRQGVRRIVLGFQVFNRDGSASRTDEIDLKLIRGGRLMDPTQEVAREIEYAIAFYHPVNGSIGGATTTMVPAGTANGSKYLKDRTDRAVCGARVHLTQTADAGLNASGWTKVRFYRKDAEDRAGSGGGDLARYWRYLGEVDNTGTPEWFDSLADPELASLPSVELNFAGIGQSLAVKAMGTWRSHMVLAVGEWLYISFAGRPRMYLPKPVDQVGVLTEEERTAGRTVAVGSGRTDRIFGVVGDDALYLAGERSLYVMVGDTANDATPPRPVPESRGIDSPRKVCRWKGGVVLAASDGLWWHRAIRGAENGETEVRELTLQVRTSYKNLGTIRAVCVRGGELWVLGSAACMRLTVPDSQGVSHWEVITGDYRDGFARSDRELALMDARGRGRFFGLAAGDPYTPAADSQWSAVMGMAIHPWSRVSGIVWHGEGAPTLTFEGIGPDRSWTKTVALDDGQKNVLGLFFEPHNRLRVTAQGLKDDRIYYLHYELENLEDKRS